MTNRVFLLAGLFSVMAFGAGGLDPLHVDSHFVRDSSNRAVILRGVTTITMNNDGKPMTMTPADYDRIRAWGYNIQQIRLEGCRLGLLPPCKPDPTYMDKLESWVKMGEEHGLYTVFKVTTYDIPGLGFSAQFAKNAWDKFWDVSTGAQDQFIAGWKPVWVHFKGRDSVVGYDILNETSPGSNTPHFNHDFLLPFYRRVLAALREVDTEKLFVFQPSLKADDSLEPLGGQRVVFGPHFYPDFGDPDVQWSKLLDNGVKVKVPVLIGEYGLPNIPMHVNNFTIKASTPERDKADAALFDSNSFGTIKTWYTNVGNWSLLTDAGEEHPRFQFFSRPYPLRTAGTPKGFRFDFTTHDWTCEWEPDAVISAPTIVNVPLKRHYPQGFKLTTSDGLQMETDRKSATGLKGKSKAYSYDFSTEMLTVNDRKAKSLKISPANLVH